MAILTADQDDVALVNNTLRDSGHAAHCLWIQTADRFDLALRREDIELIVMNCDRYPDAIRQVIKQKDAYIPEVPVIAVSSVVNEVRIQQAMEEGACDLISIEKKGRLQAVVSRELRAIRVERASSRSRSTMTIV